MESLFFILMFVSSHLYANRKNKKKKPFAWRKKKEGSFVFSQKKNRVKKNTTQFDAKMASVDACKPSLHKTTVPLSSFLAFRKAIMSMKDISCFVGLRVQRQKVLQIFVLDDFRCTSMSAEIPVCRSKPKDPEEEDDVCEHDKLAFIASEELIELGGILKTFHSAIEVHFSIDTWSVKINPVNNSNKILIRQKLLFPKDVLYPRIVQPLVDEQFYWVEVISQDLLNIFINLSIGSAIISVSLTSNGVLKLSNEHELGQTIVEKKLAIQDIKNESKDVVCSFQCVVKFVKQIVNPLINCSQKTSFLGIPRSHNADPALAWRFLLSRPNTWETFVMHNFGEILHHTTTHPTQAPFQATIVPTHLPTAMS